MKAIKILSASVVLGLSLQTNASTMENVFNELNGSASYGGPAAVQTQTMNYYHGGNISLTTPSRSYNLITAQAPSINAGCGGIDLHMGGFSFISREQFVQLMRNIGSNALGYGFKIALQNICPTCDNVMTSLQNVADRMNQFNINSCQAAKGIVHAAANEMFNTQYNQNVMNWGMQDGLYSDAVQAWREIKGAFDPQKRKAALTTLRRNNPEREKDLPTGNITWNALSKVRGLSDDDKRRFMGLIGTVILDDQGKTTAYMPDPMATKKMVSSDSSIQMRIPKCINNDCTQMNWESFESQPSFKMLVNQRMKTMSQSIAQRKPYANYNQVMAFVNATEIPVYKIVALSASLNNSTVGETMINKYSELIAVKYVQAHISLVAKTVRNGLEAQLTQEGAAAKTDNIKLLLDRITQLESQVALDAETLYNAAQTSYIVGNEVKMLENTILSSMTSTIANSLQFGNSLK